MGKGDIFPFPKDQTSRGLSPKDLFAPSPWDRKYFVCFGSTENSSQKIIAPLSFRPIHVKTHPPNKMEPLVSEQTVFLFVYRPHLIALFPKIKHWFKSETLICLFTSGFKRRRVCFEISCQKIEPPSDPSPHALPTSPHL